jgi:hypothetical protein
LAIRDIRLRIGTNALLAGRLGDAGRWRSTQPSVGAAIGFANGLLLGNPFVALFTPFCLFPPARLVLRMA